MPSPRLQHPVQVTIEQINRDLLVEDNDAREAFHGARQMTKTTVTVPAQHKVAAISEAVVTIAGYDEPMMGYILVRTVDLRRLQVTLKRGDRIIQVGTGLNAVTMDAYLIVEERMAHYPSAGGATLQKWYYGDRAPMSKAV